jgi:hypothetical protein
MPSPPMTAIRTLLLLPLLVLTNRDPTEDEGERRGRYSPEVPDISS